jgi:hypothetical protein
MRPCNSRLAAQRQRIEALLPQVVQLNLEGISHQEIARQLGVSDTTVRRWLRDLERKRTSKAVIDTAQMIAEAVHRYEEIYREAMTGWRRSQAREETPPVDDAAADGDECCSKKKRPARRKAEAGNPAFLGRAMDALKAIRAIRGLDAPRRTEVAGSGGGPIRLATVTEDDLRNMSNEQLAALDVEITARIQSMDLGPERLAAVHDLHQAGLPGELAPRGAGPDAGPGGDGALSTTDGLPSAPARQE